MLRELAHLQEQLGDEKFQALINSNNTGKVKQFCDDLVDSLPTEMTVGGRTYKILSFLRGDETKVYGHVMVDRAKKMKANLGQEDGLYLWNHRQDIPVALRKKVTFVFPDWRLPEKPEDVYCLSWMPTNHWDLSLYFLNHGLWLCNFRLLRRKYR